MVESAVADIICPTVTTEYPLAAGWDEVLVVEELLAGLALALGKQRDDLVSDLAGYCCILPVVEPLLAESLDVIGSLLASESLGHEVGDGLACTVGTDLHSKTEFCVVLEEGVLPCRSVSLCIGAVRGSREGSSVDRGATGSVRNHHPVSEELGDVLDVWGLAAAGAGTAELEERLCELGVLHVGCLVDHIVLVADLGYEPVEVLLLLLLVECGNHGEGLVLREADIDAVAATGTVVDRSSESVLVFLEDSLALGHLDLLRSLGGLCFSEQERTDGSVRADECAGVALDTLVRIPARNHDGYAALLVCGCACRHRTVGIRQECAYRE